VINNPESSTASEDFAYMLQERPGANVWMGNGSTAGLRNPGYDFNDEALSVGVAYWVNLVEDILPLPGRDVKWIEFNWMRDLYFTSSSCSCAAK
jgi:hypothetical protein